MNSTAARPAPAATAPAATTIFKPNEAVVVYGVDGAQHGAFLSTVPASLVRDAGVRVLLADGTEKRLSPRIVVSLAAALSSWHVFDADDKIVAGGPGISKERAHQIVAEYTAQRDGKFSTRLGL